MKDQRIKDQRCWAYRLGENGETVSKIFDSRAHIPVGLGWTDSPARVHEAANELKERQTVISTVDAVGAAVLVADQAKAELHDAMGDDKEALFAMAQDLGVKIDRRWSIGRLKEEIAAAQPAAEVVAEVPSDDAL